MSNSSFPNSWQTPPNYSAYTPRFDPPPSFNPPSSLSGRINPFPPTSPGGVPPSFAPSFTYPAAPTSYTLPPANSLNGRTQFHPPSSPPNLSPPSFQANPAAWHPSFSTQPFIPPVSTPTHYSFKTPQISAPPQLPAPAVPTFSLPLPPTTVPPGNFQGTLPSSHHSHPTWALPHSFERSIVPSDMHLSFPSTSQAPFSFAKEARPPTFPPTPFPVLTQKQVKTSSHQTLQRDFEEIMGKAYTLFPPLEFPLPTYDGSSWMQRMMHIPPLENGSLMAFQINHQTTLFVDSHAVNYFLQTATPAEKAAAASYLISWSKKVDQQLPSHSSLVSEKSPTLLQCLLSDIAHKAYDFLRHESDNMQNALATVERFSPLSEKIKASRPQALDDRQLTHAKIDLFFNTQQAYQYDPNYKPFFQPVMGEIPLFPTSAVVSLFGRIRSITTLEGTVVRAEAIATRALERQKVTSQTLNLNHTYLPTKPTTNTARWVLPKEGGGAFINGRWYVEHALERMAPRTPQVMAELEARALKRANAKGLLPGTEEFGKWMNRNGPNPRNIPPSVVEAEIAQPGSTGVRVILNEKGHVITVMPGGQ